MICPSCGANSTNLDRCDYCGSKITPFDTSKVLVEKDSRKADILELNDELGYVFADKNNTSQVLSRLIDSSRKYIENGDLKRAEFLLKIASEEENNQEVLLLTAKVKAWFAVNLSSSVQMAHVKKKYVVEAKKLIVLVDDEELANEKTEVQRLIDGVDGVKASQFSTRADISPGMSKEELDEKTASHREAQSTAENTAGCATIAGWITAIIIGLAMIVPYLE
jgi:hypothetical protein